MGRDKVGFKMEQKEKNAGIRDNCKGIFPSEQKTHVAG